MKGVCKHFSQELSGSNPCASLYNDLHRCSLSEAMCSRGKTARYHYRHKANRHTCPKMTHQQSVHGQSPWICQCVCLCVGEPWSQSIL